MLADSTADIITNTSDNLVDTEFLYQNSPCGYLSFLPDGTIIKINQTLLSWLEADNETIVGKTKFSSILSKGGAFYYQMVVLPQLQMQGFANEINFEIKSMSKSFPCLFNASTVKSANGQVLAINAILLNITDRKKYESQLLNARQIAEEERKRFEFLSNTIPNAIWTASPSGDLYFLSERFFETFGPRDVSVKSDSFLHLIHARDRRRTMAAWKICVQKQTNFEVEVRIKTVQSNYTWFLISAVPYLDNQKKLVNWFGSCTNINDRKEKERKKVEKLNDSLSEASEVINKKTQTLEEIAFNQSHLIRHPLSNILGITSIIREMEMDESLKQMVTMLQLSAEKLDTVIKEIVFKSRSDE
jgi:PAS domain S-box-containing protein